MRYKMDKQFRTERFIVVAVILLAVAIILGGCASSGSTQSLAPVCEALGPPHEYNSKNKNSRVHAGPDLAKRLHRDNLVGTGLRCEGY